MKEIKSAPNRVVIGVSLTSEDVDALDDAARRMGHTRSSYLRWIVRQAILSPGARMEPGNLRRAPGATHLEG